MAIPFLLAGRALFGLFRSPRVLAGLALVAAGAAVVSWHHGKVGAAYDRGVADGTAAQLLVQHEAVFRAMAAERDRQRNIERAIADAISKITVTHQTIQRNVERTVQERAVYRECRADDDVLRLFNAAMSSSGGGGVPTDPERTGAGELSF